MNHLSWSAPRQGTGRSNGPQLFREYQQSIGTDLCFQNFESELATLPGAYASPRGRLYLGLSSNKPGCCAGFAPCDDIAAEMKRSVCPSRLSGTRYGWLLAKTVIADAKSLGYKRTFVLDTLPSMKAAQAMYEALGFRDIEPYTFNPIAGTRYMGLSFNDTRTRHAASSLRELKLAQDGVEQIEAFTSRFPGFDLADGYEVARLVHEQRLQEGDSLAGRKIGFTNPGMWATYGVKQPIWGYMYDTTVSDLRDDRTWSLAGFSEPKIEPEIIFHFRDAPAASDPAALLACIDWTHGFEIVETPFPGWKFAAPDGVAADSLHGMLLVGAAAASRACNRTSSASSRTSAFGSCAMTCKSRQETGATSSEVRSSRSPISSNC